MSPYSKTPDYCRQHLSKPRVLQNCCRPHAVHSSLHGSLQNSPPKPHPPLRCRYHSCSRRCGLSLLHRCEEAVQVPAQLAAQCAPREKSVKNEECLLCLCIRRISSSISLSSSLSLSLHSFFISFFFLYFSLALSRARSLELSSWGYSSLELEPTSSSLPLRQRSWQRSWLHGWLHCDRSQQVHSSKLGQLSSGACASLPKNEVVRQEFTAEAYLLESCSKRPEATGPSLAQKQVAWPAAN